MINVRDYGATGNGIADDTDSIIHAINDSDGGAVFFPKGEYRLTQRIVLHNRPVSIYGEGKSLTRLRWEIDNGGIQFTGSGVAANDITAFEIRNICLTTGVPNGGTALHLEWPVMFANPQKKSRIADIEIRGWDAYSSFRDYWSNGIYLKNPGGLDISHTDILGSVNGAQVGIFCDSPNNSGAIRHFLSNLYILQFAIGMQWRGPNEGVYFNNFEIVGCRIGIQADANPGAASPSYSINNGHCDCYQSCIELTTINEAKLSNLTLFHSNNGGSKLPGNIISLNGCKRFTVIGNSIYGHPNLGEVGSQNGIICTDCDSGIISSNQIDQIRDTGIYLSKGTQNIRSVGNRIDNCGYHPYLNDGGVSNIHTP